MFFKLHAEYKIGIKLLTKADLGLGTSHQTHIGLYDGIFTFLSDKEEEKAELRLSIPFIVSLVVFSLFSLAATIGIFFSVYFIFLALPLWVLTYGFYKLNKLSIIIWGILLLILSILGCIGLFSGSGKVFAAFVPVGTALLNYLADLLKRS